MKYLKKLLAVLVLTLNVCAHELMPSFSPGDQHHMTFYVVGKGIKLNVQIIKLVPARRTQECIRFCMEYKGCMSINIFFNKTGHIYCYLLPVDQNSRPNNFERKSQWEYMDTGPVQDKIGPYCQSLRINPCPVCRRCVDLGQPKTYKCVLYSSCEELLKAKDDRRVRCFIKPYFLKKRVQVLCKADNTTVWIVFEHTSNKDILVHGYEKCASYNHTLAYKVSLSDMITFVDRSIYCQQWTWIKCQQSTFLANVQNSCGWLNNRYWAKMLYFGGGPAFGTGCACGLTNTCYNKKYKCNCDANVNEKLFDHGFVTLKRDLPITKITLGDTGSKGEYVRFKLGPLMCRN